MDAKSIENIRSEIAREISEARRNGETKGISLDDNIEYQNARKKQARFELSLCQDCDETALDIYKFIGNKDFIDVCKKERKQFTDEEQVALVIRSDYATLEEKFEFLQKLAEGASSTLRDAINEWIKYQTDCLEYVRQINQNDVVFVVDFERPIGNNSVFRKFDDAEKNRLSCDISIHKVCDSKENSRSNLGRIIYSIEARRDTAVSSIHIFDNTIFKELPSFQKTLYNISVEMPNPYKEYDVVEVPMNLGTLVIAPSQEKDKKAESINRDEKSWLQVEIPTVYLETSPYNAYGRQVGDPVFLIQAGWFISLSKFEKIENGEMTIRQKAYIDEIKTKVEKFHYDN